MLPKSNSILFNQKYGNFLYFGLKSFIARTSPPIDRINKIIPVFKLPSKVDPYFFETLSWAAFTTCPAAASIFWPIFPVEVLLK
jgi:hypothetical protein